MSESGQAGMGLCLASPSFSRTLGLSIMDLAGSDLRGSAKIGFEMLNVLKGLNPTEPRRDLNDDGIGSSDLKNLQWANPFGA
eukprot:2796194-Rhodomonas_salina.1